MKVVWIGPLVSESEIDKSAAISPAANDWQLGMIRGLMENGANVTVISYFPEPIWPKGNLFISAKQKKIPAVEIRFVDYVNLMMLREYILGIKFSKELKKIIGVDNIPDAVITYNPSKMNCTIGTFFQTQYGGQWASIVADGYSGGSPDKEIFLSYGYFCKSDRTKKLHIDGATAAFKEIQIVNNSNRVIIFTGTLDKWTGILDFALQFEKLKNEGFELHIYGKGEDHNLQTIANRCQAVKIKGFVSGEELSEACKKAYAFINPRPTHLSGIENNFPSKILHYLTFGRPILSSKTAGLSPVYDDLLYYYDPLDIDTLAKVFNKIESFTNEELQAIKSSSRSFCERSTWKNQALKVLQFLKEEGKSKS